MDGIVSVTFRHVPPEGNPTDLRVGVGRPYPDPAGDWTCSVLLPGSPNVLVSVHGIDPLQALCLAVDRIRHDLEPYRGRLYWPGTDDPVPLHAYVLGSGFLDG